MSVKYLKLNISIHGVDVKNEAAASFLIGWLKAATVVGLTTNGKCLFNFRDARGDVEIEIEEFAGEYGDER